MPSKALCYPAVPTEMSSFRLLSKEKIINKYSEVLELFNDIYYSQRLFTGNSKGLLTSDGSITPSCNQAKG